MRRRAIAFALLILSVPLLADVTVLYKSDYKLGFALAPGAAGQIPEASLAALNRPSEIRIKGNKAYQTLGKFVSITDLTTNEVTYVDSDRKRFGTAPAEQISAIIAKAMPKVPELTRSIADMIKTEVESRKTGRTETIHGVQAEESEVVVTLNINLPNMPVSGPAVRMVMQLWRATPDELEHNPALGELARYSNLTASSMDPASMFRQFSGPLQGFSQSFGPLFEEMNKDKALLLRTHMEATSPIMAVLSPQALPAGMDPNGPLVSGNQEIVELSTDTVDESVFRIPEGYRKVEVEEILRDEIAAMAGSAR